MSTCTSCSAVETYDNYDWMPKPVNESFAQESLEKQKPAGCAVKDSMTNCLYTAQGMFVCQKEVGQKAVVPNSGMAEWGANVQEGVSKTASPWMSEKK